MIKRISIRSIKKEEVETVQKFLFNMIKKLYNYDENPSYHNDIINMKEFYIDEERNSIIGAFDDGNRLIGTIAVKQYIDRIKAVKGVYNEYKTAEMGRCYIDENLRRKGIGSLLFDRVVEFCRDSKYETIYLHTHKHLPGGFDFWKKKGFLITVEEDDIDQTVHMEKRVF